MNAKITTLVRDHEFSAIIGMLDFERITPQKVRINAEFKSENFIDYVEVINFIEEFYGEQKFQSVEDSVSRTAQALKVKFPSSSGTPLQKREKRKVSCHAGWQQEIR